MEVHVIQTTNYQFKPKVSVIIPVYNIEEYIIKCLDSIINQILYEIEIIVVNDCSIDNCLKFNISILKFIWLKSKILIEE